MIDFFMEGGWGMWPVLLFGFFFFATSVLSVIARARNGTRALEVWVR